MDNTGNLQNKVLINEESSDVSFNHRFSFLRFQIEGKKGKTWLSSRYEMKVSIKLIVNNFTSSWKKQETKKKSEI